MANDSTMSDGDTTTPGLTVPDRRAAPHPPRCFLFGNVLELRRDPLAFFAESRDHYGDVVELRLGPPGLNVRYFLISSPQGIQHVLRDNQANYRKSVFYKAMKRLMGEGLVTSEGDLWRRQRRLAQPGFHHDRIVAFSRVMTDAVARQLRHWDEHAVTGWQVDIAAEMMQLTLEIVAETLFSAHLAGRTEEIGKALAVALEQHNARLMARPPWIVLVPVALDRRLVAALRTLNRTVTAIIRERQRPDSGGDDLLGLLMRARDDGTGKAMSEAQLRDEVMTFLMAGHETTGNALAWTWYLLSLDRQVEERLQSEVDQVLNGRTPTSEDLPALPYTRRIIEESMRLYPPIWTVDRDALHEDRIEGFRIPRGSVVGISPYVMHRHPRYWPDPEKFDPQRFLPDRVADRPRFAYLPFGGGPRGCIGEDYALTELQLVVAAVAQRYRLRLVPGQHIQPEPTITLRPRGGIRMTIERRADPGHAPRSDRIAPLVETPTPGRCDPLPKLGR